MESRRHFVSIKHVSRLRLDGCGRGGRVKISLLTLGSETLALHRNTKGKMETPPQGEGGTVCEVTSALVERGQGVYSAQVSGRGGSWFLYVVDRNEGSWD